MTTEHTCTRHAPGTPTCYRDHACRCTECRQAGNAYGKRSHAGLTRRIPSHLIVRHLERIGITDRDAPVGRELLADVNPTFNWVRLAQRVPVRVHIDEAPKGLQLVAGTTCSVVIPGIGRKG